MKQLLPALAKRSLALALALAILLSLCPIIPIQVHADTNGRVASASVETGTLVKNEYVDEGTDVSSINATYKVWQLSGSKKVMIYLTDAFLADFSGKAKVEIVFLTNIKGVSAPAASEIKYSSTDGMKSIPNPTAETISANYSKATVTLDDAAFAFDYNSKKLALQIAAPSQKTIGIQSVTITELIEDTPAFAPEFNDSDFAVVYGDETLKNLFIRNPHASEGMTATINGTIKKEGVALSDATNLPLITDKPVAAAGGVERLALGTTLSSFITEVGKEYEIVLTGTVTVGGTPYPVDHTIKVTRTDMSYASATIVSTTEAEKNNVTAIRGYDFTDGQRGFVNPSPIADGGLVAWTVLGNKALTFTLAPKFVETLGGKAVITVEYFDSSTGQLHLVYDTAANNETVLDTGIQTLGSGDLSQKTGTITVSDAVFANACGEGFSFALKATGNRMYIKSVTVTKYVAPPVNYTTELNSAVTDLKFYDDAAMDLALSAKTDGADEAVKVAYTLSGGNLTEAVTGSSDVTVTSAGVGILDAAWFNEKVTGYGEYILNVVVTKDDVELVKNTYTFSRNYAYDLNMISAGGKTELVYIEDEAYDLVIKLQKQYGDPKDNLTLEYSINGGTPVVLTPVTVPAAEAASVALDLSSLTDFGSYELVCNLKDGDTLLATKTFPFVRKMATTILSDLRSDNAENTALEYKDDAAYDLKLYLQHRIPVATDFTVLYTIFKDGVALEGLTDKTIAVTGLNETKQAFALELPAVDLYGDFTLALTIKDGEGNPVHTKEFAFSRYLVNFTNTAISSENANDGYVFADDTPYDLKLSVQKADGNDELLKISYVLVNTADPSTVIKEGSFADQVYSGTTPTVLDLAEILADVTAFGTYELKLTITNTRGLVQNITHTFSRLASFKVTLSSAGNAGENLVFPEDKEYDLKLSLLKQTGADVVCDVVYTVSQGETVYGPFTIDDVSISGTPNVLDLAMTGVAGNGSFAIVVSLVDAEGNTFKSEQFTVGRVPKMDVEFVYPGAESSSTQDTVTFIDYVPYNIVLNTKKQNGDPQDMVVKYVLTGADGKVVLGVNENEIAETKTLSIGSAEFVPVAIDLSTLNDCGTNKVHTYTLTVTILDVYGNVAKEVSIDVARKDTLKTALNSSNSDLVYTENDGAFDMTLYGQMQNDFGDEEFTIEFTVTAPDGTEIKKVNETAIIPAPVGNGRNYYKVPLTTDLANYTEVFGTYTAALKITDTANRVREEVVYKFYRIQSENSIKATMGCTGHDLIFTDKDVIDPILQITKTEEPNKVPEKFTILLTITDEAGNTIPLPIKEGSKWKAAEGNAVTAVVTFSSARVDIAKEFDLSGFTKTGTYKVNISLTDDTNHPRFASSYEFKIVEFDTITSQMGNTSHDLVFVAGKDAIDPGLILEKTDGIKEDFNVSVTITDKSGKTLTFTRKDTNTQADKLEVTLNEFGGRQSFSLADHIDFSGITEAGVYNVNLTVTDDTGNKRHIVSYPFYVVSSDSVVAELLGANKADLIYTLQGGINPGLHLYKTDEHKLEEKFDVTLTISDETGATLALFDKDGNKYIYKDTDGTEHSDLSALQKHDFAVTDVTIPLAGFIDFSKTITKLGTYKMNVTLTDDSNNVRLVSSLEFKVVEFDTVTSEMGNANHDLIFVAGKDTIDPSLQLVKSDKIMESFQAIVTVTDKDGEELPIGANGATKLETKFDLEDTKIFPLADFVDFSGITKAGVYNVNLTVVDDAGSERHKASYPFTVVISNSVQSKIETASKDMIFVSGKDAIDFVLQFNKTDKVKEYFNALVTITDKDGKDLTFTRKDTNAQADKLEKGFYLETTQSVTLADFIDFSGITKPGIYKVNVTLKDDAGNERHKVSRAFAVVDSDNVKSAISSSSYPDLRFLSGDVTDLVLSLTKTDNLKEGFEILVTITDATDKELMSYSSPLNAFTSVKTSLKALKGLDLSTIVEKGNYNVNVTLTDDAGNVRHKVSHSFSIPMLDGSVDTAVTSATNGDLIFTEGQDFDLVLHLRKNDGIAEKFTAYFTITDKDGEELKKVRVGVPARETLKVTISDLIDLSDLPATGIFNLNLVLVDVAGNERLNKTTAFCRVAQASVMTQISSSTNSDMIFTDKDTVDLNLYVQKTDGIDETLHIKYTVTSPSGAVIATKEGNVKALSGSKYFKATLDNLPELTEHGTYKIHLVITDNSGIVRSESVTQLARISGTGIKHQISSSSGTNLQFSANKPFDMCLFVQKTDGVKESFQGQVYVTDPYGNVIFSIKGKINVPASGYFRFPLDLSKGTAFGTYKASYTLHDDAGTLRASGTTYFSRFSDDAVRAAVQSASGKFPGLIYGKDDAFDLALYLQKTDGLEQMLQVRYTISDMNGLVLETKQGRITVPATGYRKLPIDLSDVEALQKFGIYNFKLEVANTDGTIIFTEDYSFSRVLVPEEQLDILGVCTHLSKRGMTTKQAQQYVDLARQAGVKFWRDELPWSTVEPAKGQYNIPASADAAVDYTLSIGMEPLFILDYGNDLYGSDVTTDEWLEGYLGYVKTVVTHFKGRIKYFEVWNEWNIGLGGMDKKYREMADIYANLLIETYKVIKEIDPKVTVIGGVVAGGELKWTENMLKYPEVINAMDAFSFHCYPDNDIKEIQDQVEKLRKLFKEYGREDIPMWLTETGWPTHIGRDGFTEEVSAGNLVSLYTWAIANPGVLDRIFWYDLHNDGEEAEYLEHNLGLLRNWDAEVETVPMAAKKSYVAMNAMNAILLGAEYVGTYDMGHKSITAHRFNKDGKDLLVVWADDCTLNMVATIGNSNMVVTDMYGNANALTPVNGKVTLFLSDAPVYIEYDLDDTLELKEGGFKLDKAMYSATPAATFPLQITRNSGLETFEGTYAFSMPEGWSVEGVEFGAAQEGATEITDTVYVTVGDDASKGETSISVRVISDGNVMGQFSVPIEMGDICTVNPDVVFTDDGHEFKLSVQVINENSTKPLTGTINLLAPAVLIGNTKASVPFEIPAGENKAVLIDIPAAMANTFHTAKVEVVLGSGAKHTVTKPVSFLYAIEAPEDMKLDGVIDEQWADAMEFTAGEKDWENDNSSDIEWPGNTAKGYVMWDNEYLYVAVEAYDESHYQTATGTSIWLGDSIQMAIDVSRFTVPGYTGYNEIGFSLNSETGAIENWNWYAAPGENVSEGGIFKIVRDDDACTTTYEVALPWSEQLPAGEELNLNSVGFSLIVNENSLDEDGDPTGRTGWIEYMSGIGRRKDPTVFGDLILAKRPTE